MKYGDNNYACVKNCGRTKSNNDTDDKPLSISLLSNRVKKRESKLHKLSSYNTTPKTFRQTKKNMPIKKTAGKKKMETKNFSESMTILSHSESLKKTILSLQETLEKIKSKYFVSAVTESTCSKLGKQATKEDSEENDVE
ncbi:unnamed protein product [Diatraea saccharalis]|uniref:Uncharacterized protein n=1 Tax=Diatraea saccharalis TaxID=40085 RepID=A0A9N9R6N5_9NEOP|nr:unnamed protein product [Diatraea saccharalis]